MFENEKKKIIGCCDDVKNFDIKALGVLFLISYPCLNYFDSFICWFFRF